ncbi:LOW QUALITY PROTEIN: uncharacterized protein ACBR49_001270 [Aulostomus maculatus]
MTVEYQSSTETRMDMDDSNIQYKQLLADGSKLRYSVYALRNSPYKVAMLCLGLLCVVLVFGVIGQSVHYQRQTQDSQKKFKVLSDEKENLKENLKTVQNHHLRDRYNWSASEKDKIAGSNLNLTREKDTLQATYNTLRKATDELQVAYNSHDSIRRVARAGGSFEISCYYVSVGKKTGTRAENSVRNKEGDLAIVTSQEEMAFINGLFGSDKELWIGLTDEGVEGQWKWWYWAKDQPNSYSGRNQDCVEFWHQDSGQGEWNDENCNFDQNWICEV